MTMRKSWCLFCNGCKRSAYTIKEVKKYAELLNGECLSDKYINNKQNLTWKCNICKHIWKTNFKAVKIQNNWCPLCSGRINNNLENIKQLAIDRNGECLSTQYKNNKTNLIWKCNVCQYVWKARLDRVKTGTWCPGCRRSLGERVLIKLLDRRNIKYICEYPIINGMKFDFYLKINGIKTAIEFDGIQHFHICRRYVTTEEMLSHRQKLDIEKTLYCIKNNIKLIRIDYTTLKCIDLILDNMLIYEDMLIFTSWELYQYIIDKLPTKYNFLLLLTSHSLKYITKK
jgi:hypothetical protein